MYISISLKPFRLQRSLDLRLFSFFLGENIKVGKRYPGPLTFSVMGGLTCTCIRSMIYNISINTLLLLSVCMKVTRSSVMQMISVTVNV